MVAQVKPTTKNSPKIHTGHAKNTGSAEQYTKPHTMSGKEVTAAETENGYKALPTKARAVNMSVGSINRDGYDPAPKTTGIKIRGTGAATKGTMARGPMA